MSNKHQCRPRPKQLLRVRAPARCAAAHLLVAKVHVNGKQVRALQHGGCRLLAARLLHQRRQPLQQRQAGGPAAAPRGFVRGRPAHGFILNDELRLACRSRLRFGDPLPQPCLRAGFNRCDMLVKLKGKLLRRPCGPTLTQTLACHWVMLT